MQSERKTAGAGDSSAGAGYQRRTAETAEKTLLMMRDHLMHGCRTAGSLLSGISLLSHRNIFEYTSDLVTASETGAGEVTLSFSGKVTGYNLQQIDTI